MKIIFLDIDGVLNSRSTFCKPILDEIDQIDPANIEQLNRILKQTGAYLVISSDWRCRRSLEKLKQIASIVGVNPEKIIDKTPVIDDVPRGIEIKQWLDNNQYEKFVIIDDHDDMGELLQYLVQTSSKTGGLTEEKANEVISLLN
jgi:hypothetical protein